MARIKAIFFDQDGVIIDTERDGHRVAFNETFKAHGFDFEWGVEEYHELLQIAGGKERMRHYFKAHNLRIAGTSVEEDEIKKMHKDKTAKFIELIESGQLPLRPGIRRLMKEANQAGLVIGICTTSDIQAAGAIAHKILADIQINFVLAGDMVGKKKPDPEIYLLALQKSGLTPAEAVVVEDSRNGLMAAKNAGLPVIVTVNPYTEKEDLKEADLILSCLGDMQGEKGRLMKGGQGLGFDGALHAKQIVEYFSR